MADQEDNVIYMDGRQGDMIGMLKDIVKNAEQGEIQNVFVLSIDSEGILKMGRAGGFSNIQDYILLLGGFELHKDYVLAKMLEAQFDEDEFYDEEED